MRPGDAAQGWLSFLPHGLTGCCGDEAGRRLWKGLWGTVGPCVCVGGHTLVSIIWKRLALRQGLLQLERRHLLLLVWPSKKEVYRHELSILALGVWGTSDPLSHMDLSLATPFLLS